MDKAAAFGINPAILEVMAVLKLARLEKILPPLNTGRKLLYREPRKVYWDVGSRGLLVSRSYLA